MNGTFAQNETSINLYTGTPAIDIPIYTITTKRLQSKILLNYKGDAIKVQDITGMVGVNWNLVAGGAITRVIKGLPDEKSTGYLNNTARIAGDITTTDYADLASESSNGSTDTEQDTYYSSLGGKILFQSRGPLITGNAIFTNYSGINILSTPLMPGISGEKSWVLVDNNGNKYFFGSTAASRELVNSNAVGAPVNNDYYVSTWYLDKIISLDGQDSLVFKYTKEGPTEYTFYKKGRKKIITTTNGQEYVGEDSGETSENLTVKIQNQLYLSSIEAPGITVTFGYRARNDFSTKCLSEITVMNPALLTKYHLSYGYFKDAAGNSNARLKLSEINQEDKGKLSHLVAKFTYNEIVNLPSRNSVQFDHWGYYNSNQANTSLPPDANKDADPVRMKANLLTEIEWGNGSVTNYSYEARDAIYQTGVKTGGGVRMSAISRKDNGKEQITSFRYVNEDGTSSGIPYKSEMDYSFSVFIPYGPIGSSTSAVFYTDQTYSDMLDQYGIGIGYSRVQVIYNDGGAEVNLFSNQKQWRDTSEQYKLPYQSGIRTFYDAFGPPFSPLSSLGFMRGLLVEKQVYRNDGRLLNLIKNEYAASMIDSIYCMRALPVVSRNYPTVWKIARYKEYSAIAQLVSTTETASPNGPGSGSLESFKRFEFYEPLLYSPSLFIRQYPFLIRKLFEAHTARDTLITEYRYPMDISATNPSNSIFSRMIAWNQVTSPVEVVNWLKRDNVSKVVGGSISLFKPDIVETPNTRLAIPLPSKMLTLKLSDPITDYKYLTADAYDQRYGEEISFEKYDGKLNNTEQKVKGLFPNAIIWDERTGNYAIAEAANATRAEVYYMGFEMLSDASLSAFPDIRYGGARTGHAYYKNFTTTFTPPNSKTYKISYWYKSNGTWNYSGEKNYVKGMVLTATEGIDDIRIYPVNARINTYTYEPLVGITSKTDHNGVTQHYEYDDLQRLKIVRDDKRNIVKQYAHYNNLPNNNAPYWQNMYNFSCVRNAANQLTGEQQQQQRDINPNSTTYNSTRWVSLGQTNECTLP